MLGTENELAPKSTMQPQVSLLAPGSRPFVIECTKLTDASVMPVMNGETGSDTIVDVSEINPSLVLLVNRLALH